MFTPFSTHSVLMTYFEPFIKSQAIPHPHRTLVKTVPVSLSLSFPRCSLKSSKVVTPGLANFLCTIFVVSFLKTIYSSEAIKEIDVFMQ